jgi:hypothetical protein
VIHGSIDSRNADQNLFGATSSVGRGGRPGRLPGAQVAGGTRFQYKKGRDQGRRQGNGGLVVGWWVACGKNVKSYYKKKVVKIFSDGNFGGWSAS